MALTLKGMRFHQPHQEEVADPIEAVQTAFWAREYNSWRPVELVTETGAVVLGEADLLRMADAYGATLPSD